MNSTQTKFIRDRISDINRAIKFKKSALAEEQIVVNKLEEDIRNLETERLLLSQGLEQQE